MRFIIIGAIAAVGPFDTKNAARQYLNDNVPEQTRHRYTIMVLLPKKPPENGQLPL